MTGTSSQGVLSQFDERYLKALRSLGAGLALIAGIYLLFGFGSPTT